MTSSFTEIPVNCSIKEGDKGRFQLLWKKKSQMWFFFSPSLQFLRNLLDVLGTRRRQSVLNNLGRLRTIGKRAKKHAEWGDKCRTARASRDGGRGWPWDENSENEVHEPNPGAGCMSDRLEGGTWWRNCVRKREAVNTFSSVVHFTTQHIKSLGSGRSSPSSLNSTTIMTYRIELYIFPRDSLSLQSLCFCSLIVGM